MSHIVAVAIVSDNRIAGNAERAGGTNPIRIVQGCVSVAVVEKAMNPAVPYKSLRCCSRQSR